MQWSPLLTQQVKNLPANAERVWFPDGEEPLEKEM